MLTQEFLATALLAVVCGALPPPRLSMHDTHRAGELRQDNTVLGYYPQSNFQTFGDGLDYPLTKRAGDDLEGGSISFVQSHLNISVNSISFKSGFANDVAKHAFLKQVINGIPVANAVANVAFNNKEKVVSFGHSFVRATNIPSTTPSISVQDAISKAETLLNGTFNKVPTTLEFIAKQDSSVALTHVIQIQNDDTGTWVEGFVDAHSGELIHVTNFVAEASYRVLPITKQYPPQGFETLVDPQDLSASPFGWHSDGRTNTTVTSGNNAISFIGSESDTTSQSSAVLNFIYIQDPTEEPTIQRNIDAARTNAFYVVNTVHDISYKYGFTEAAFNFQNNNFGRGGAGNDRVTISVQDASGIDNANFATPPDGQSGIMRMFLWDLTRPQRDGSLENDIIVHENTHGITNRMTGGGTGRCLQTEESAGLGEGWSDAMAEWVQQKDAIIRDFITGQYVTNQPGGIRRFPYSVDPNVNPLRYSSLQELDEVHDIGEVWANMLHNVYAALVKALGFSNSAHTDPTTTAGNTIFLHLFIDALPLQPCNPTFLEARDAWIQADINRYRGANTCVLWKAFASRGLGVNAADYEDDDTIPAGC